MMPTPAKLEHSNVVAKAIAFKDFLRSAWQQHPLYCALVVSLLIHVVFLSFRWGMGEIQNRRLSTPLSVVLVNASHQQAPKQANKLAHK